MLTKEMLHAIFKFFSSQDLGILKSVNFKFLRTALTADSSRIARARTLSHDYYRNLSLKNERRIEKAYSDVASNKKRINATVRAVRNDDYLGGAVSAFLILANFPLKSYLRNGQKPKFLFDSTSPSWSEEISVGITIYGSLLLLILCIILLAKSGVMIARDIKNYLDSVSVLTNEKIKYQFQKELILNIQQGFDAILEARDNSEDISATARYP